MTQVYFDNSATTPLCDCAKKAITDNFDIFGNPSSLHDMGVEAEKILTNARKQIADTLGCTKDEIIFTSCGSEANNLAIIGGAMAKIRRGNRVITTDSEHPSVSECFKKLEDYGFEVIKLSTVGGKIDIDELTNALDDKTVLVSIMHTNNETGAVYNVNKLYPIIQKKSPEALIHCDFVQGYMKSTDIPRAHLITISAHKIHAPKGVGALYKKKGVRILPQLLGGGQEGGMRSGTENPLLISAFGCTAEYFHKNLTCDIKHMQDIKDYLTENLENRDGIVINTPQTPAPNILSVAVTGIKSEVMLHFLSQKGVYVSSGSACSSKKAKAVF